MIPHRFWAAAYPGLVSAVVFIWLLLVGQFLTAALYARRLSRFARPRMHWLLAGAVVTGFAWLLALPDLWPLHILPPAQLEDLRPLFLLALPWLAWAAAVRLCWSPPWRGRALATACGGLIFSVATALSLAVFVAIVGD